MNIYNTLSNRLEEFKPIEKNKVRMYVCGPTVYNYIHIGNARPVVFFDVVRRYFLYLGYDVKFASNLTDVNDKIYLQTLKENIDELAIAKKYSDAFLEDAQNLNSLPADVVPRVTEYIEKIVKYVEQLIEKGFAYESDGDVYFRVTKLKEYGKLSGQKIDDLISGARVELNEKKENPLDFMLWKHNTEGNTYDAPFGDGRPGWHTECSAMIDDIFAGEVDIHGGGSDLRFPHHENELAQTKALHGRNLARIWMHNGRLDLNDDKMSKSLGNTILVRDLLKEYDANAYRLLLLSTYYRSPINYTTELMDYFKNEYEKVLRAKKQLFLDLDLNDAFSDDVFDEASITELEKAMNDDFNTPNVITGLQSLVKRINVSLRGKDNKDILVSLYNSLETYLYVLGLKIDLERMESSDKELYLLWQGARKNKEFDKADEYRKELVQKGII
ncbi:cysteine--tRNA ligase [Mycoplasmatota bacterium]|nr:cysteine--tRNA ligase [Mycoplasmatota bacterium]